MNTCPLTKQPCDGGSGCLFVVKLDDFEGCAFDLADKAIQDFKANTLLPAALKLDGMAKKYLKDKN